jgi:hypothetical protein
MPTKSSIFFSKDYYNEQDGVKHAAGSHGMFNIIHPTWVIKTDFIIRKNKDYRREEFTPRKD